MMTLNLCSGESPTIRKEFGPICCNKYKRALRTRSTRFLVVGSFGSRTLSEGVLLTPLEFLNCNENRLFKSSVFTYLSPFILKTVVCPQYWFSFTVKANNSSRISRLSNVFTHCLFKHSNGSIFTVRQGLLRQLCRNNQPHNRISWRMKFNFAFTMRPMKEYAAYRVGRGNPPS